MSAKLARMTLLVVLGAGLGWTAVQNAQTAPREEEEEDRDGRSAGHRWWFGVASQGAEDEDEDGDVSPTDEDSDDETN